MASAFERTCIQQSGIAKWSAMFMERVAMQTMLHAFFGMKFDLADSPISTRPYEFEVVFISGDEVSAKMIAFKRPDGIPCLAIIKGQMGRVIIPIVGDAQKVMAAIGDALA